MVIGGLTDYLALSGEPSESRRGSAGEWSQRGPSATLGRAMHLRCRGRSRLPAAQAGSGGQVTVRKSGNGITYWSAESAWYSADKRLFQQGKLALNITRDYYVLQ